MYAKLESGVLKYAPKYITVDGSNVWNASASDYIALGWYPVIYTDAPEIDEHHEAIPSWSQESVCIRQTWTVIEIPEPSDDDELDDEQVARVLMGETL